MALSLERCVGCHIVCRWHLLLLLLLMPHSTLQCRLLRAMHHSQLRVPRRSPHTSPHSISFPRLWGSRVLFVQLRLIRPLKAASATAQSASKTVFLRPIPFTGPQNHNDARVIKLVILFMPVLAIFRRLEFVGTIVVHFAGYFQGGSLLL